MKHFNSILVNLLLLLFFLHGILYFIYPSEINNEYSYIKILKYIILFFFFSFFLFKIDFKNILFSLIFLFYFLSMNLISYNFNFSLSGMKYIIPFIIILMFYKIILNDSNLLKVSIIIYLFISLFAYIEYYFFNEIFTKFSYGEHGYRCSSILVNPNNFGITITLFTIFIFENIRNNFLKMILLINTSLMIYFSFSKTAMLVFILYLMFKYYKLSISLSPILLVLGVYLFSSLDYNFTSFLVRIEYNNNFLKLANDNIIFPFLSAYQYTDNIFLNLWGTFGFFGLLIFILFNQFVLIILFLKKEYKHLFYIFIFLIIGFTTNFLYLWPLGYIYWGYMFYLCENFIKIKSRKALA